MSDRALFRLAAITLFLAFIVFATAMYSRVSSDNVLVKHKGELVCVDAKSVDSHLKHGDSTEYKPCEESTKTSE